MVSISAQTRAAFAAKFQVPALSVMERLSWFFKSHLTAKMGTPFHVLLVDTTFSRDFSLLESAREFIRRFRATTEQNHYGQLPMLASSCPGMNQTLFSC